MEIPLLQTTDTEHNCALADRTCGNEDIRSYVRSHNAEYVIPSRQNTKNHGPVDWHFLQGKTVGGMLLNKFKQACCIFFSLYPSCCWFVEMTWPEDFSDRP